MRESIEDFVQLFRDGDPAAGIDIETVLPSFDLIAERASHVAPVRRGWSSGRVHPRRIVLVVCCVVASLVAIAVGWPGAGSGGDSEAYAVTTRPDGSVDFNLSAALNYDPSDLQARLRAAGVRAVVLFESPPGQCNQTVPNGDSSVSSRVIQIRKQDHAVIIDPKKLAADETIIFMLPPRVKPREAQMPAVVSVVVTRQKPPTCVPQTAVAIPAPTGRQAPSSGASRIASSIPRPVSSGG